MQQPRALAEDPARYRWPILTAAAVALAVWWGVGLPYSLYTWLLDDLQLRWVLICYAWEVPVAGFLGPVLFFQIWWRDIERHWARAFTPPPGTTPAEREAAFVAVETALLDYPGRMSWVLMVTSLAGYAVGAFQLRVFSQMPYTQVAHVCLLGVVTGLVGALFAYLYLEPTVAPLVRVVAAYQPTTPPRGRRVPLSRKVFACSLVLTLTALPLLSTVFLNDGSRVLESELGKRLAAEVGALGADLRAAGPDAVARWRAVMDQAPLAAPGRAVLVDRDGSVLAGGGVGHPRLGDLGLRPSSLAAALGAPTGHVVDRVYTPRLLAFADAGDGRRLVAVVPWADVDQALGTGLQKALVVALGILGLALFQGFLFSRQLTRPIGAVTAMASRIATAPSEGWPPVVIRTNDEVGTLAVAFNQMMATLDETRRALDDHRIDLERRVAEATRSIETLYDVTRAITSTLEVDHVLRVVSERTLSALGVPRLVLLSRPVQPDGASEAYAAAAGGKGGRLALDGDVDAAGLVAGPRAAVLPAADAAERLPPAILLALAPGDLICVPLVFQSRTYGAILVPHAAAIDLELAEALAAQAAVALANAGLFETVRRHERELRDLSEMQVQLQEQRLRSLSRELHDGLGQALLAIKLDLGMLDSANGEPLPERLAEVRGQVTEAIQEVRRISQLLRPSMLDDLGLVPTLRWLADQFGKRTGLAVDLRLPALAERLPAAIEVLLYRVTQEALTNVSKHAAARHVSVELQAGGGTATLRIGDDGKGFDVDRYRRTPTLWGVGLLGMRERAAYHGGRIDIRSRPRHGVTIVLSIPIAVDGAPRMPAVDDPEAQPTRSST